MSDNGFPRRIRRDLWLPAERVIQEAVDLVEQLGADVALTDAVILLGKARERVADYIDEHYDELEPRYEAEPEYPR
jgi:hypothetical protein